MNKRIKKKRNKILLEKLVYWMQVANKQYAELFDFPLYPSTEEHPHIDNKKGNDQNDS